MPKTMQPAVTIVIPLYNKEREVGRAIDSALAQTFQDFELIIVDDGSTDKSASAASSYQDERIRLVQKENGGVSSARNRGVAEALSDMVAFLDADDEWLPEFLETVMALKRSFPDCGLYATSYFFAKHNQQLRGAILNGLPEEWSEGVIPDYFAVAAKSDPPVCSSSVAVKKSAIEAIGGFPTGIRSGEDLLTWARLASRFSIAYSRYIGAVFWMPDDVTARPERFLGSGDDTVGKELAKLFDAASEKEKPGLRSYLGRWHEMRAIIALQRNRNSDCLHELGKISAYVKPAPKHILLAMLACLPGSLPARAYQWLKRIRNNRPARRGMNGTT